MSLSIQEHIFDWRPDYPLVTTAKRYLDDSPTNLGKGYTLVFAHGAGFNKEQWEPTINHLFALSRKHAAKIRLREAWSVECPNHGDAAVLNEEVLLRGGYDDIFSWDEYTKVLYLFLTQNSKIPFHTHKIIGVGHSMGAVSIAMTQTYVYAPKLESLILCEPMTFPTDVEMPKNARAVIKSWPAMTLKRRDIWPNVEELVADLSSKKSFQVYDKDVLKAYLDHGFRRLPTKLYRDKEGVTLKTMKFIEAACYRDLLSAKRFYDFLPTLTTRIPVHIIWGEIDDSIPRPIKNIITNASRGCKPTSVSRVKGAGHLIVQMTPKDLAERIFSVISGEEILESKL